jgi:hypothetical protein
LNLPFSINTNAKGTYFSIVNSVELSGSNWRLVATACQANKEQPDAVQHIYFNAARSQAGTTP